MNWIHRYYEDHFHDLLQKPKVLVVYGPRQVGKTSLIQHMLEGREKMFTGDGYDMDVKEILESMSVNRLKSAFSNYDLIFIDEAQKIENAGIALKLLADHLPEIQVIVSGSSSFDLSKKIGEPLVGRQIISILYPVSILEIANNSGGMNVIQQLENLMIYGGYPEVLNAPGTKEKARILVNLRDSLLLKDILELDNIRNSSKILDLLRLLAFQVGMEVSLNELGNQLQLARQTVEKYLDLLEKAFIIKKVEAFATNHRKEISKSQRYYFWDNGIRNAVINNFNPVRFRNDMGLLWENLMFAERMKTREYKNIHANTYFWRSYNQKEIDLVEEREGKLHGYEFKWGTKKSRPSRLWLETYENATYQVINQENFLEFLTQK